MLQSWYVPSSAIMARRGLLALTGLLALGGCQGAGRNSGLRQSPQLFDEMGEHQWKVVTGSPEAQWYFDQGLVWAYAFNHDEAIRSFERAADIDPRCAMAWWGVALCHGPHINNPVMEEARSRAAWTALQKALILVDGASPKEQALIRALSRRYADPPPADRKPLDEAYAAAMRDVWLAHQDDADIGTLYAEAMMDVQPWNLWTRSGEPIQQTSEILAVLEAVMRLDADHPGANHLYIHAVEAGPNPEKGIASADRLRTMVPISGHLVHMPSHIDVQVGAWAKAADQNERAIEADRRYRKLVPRHGFYHVYMAHNHHFLAFAAMMEGRQQLALAAAREMIAGVPEDFAREKSMWIDPWMSIAMDVLMRFGRWDELLKEPAPPEYLPITGCMWHFKRGVAYAAKGQVAEAEKEQAAFAAAVRTVPEGAMMAINPAHKVLGIAEHVLAGEIAYRREDIEKAVAELRRGVELEDDLLYMEPPEWIQPVRHTLGAVLVDAKRYDEAEQVYREDLKIWPENGWSLLGLGQCLRAKGATAESQAVEARRAKVWGRADVRAGTSCLCVAGR